MGGTPSPFLLLARGAAGLLRQVKNAGEKMRGEGLIPLCGRKYSPIKENELKVGCGGGRGKGGNRAAPSRSCHLQWGCKRRG